MLDIRVSEIVKAKVFNVGIAQGLLQHLPDAALRQVLAEFVGEYQIWKSVIVPCCASVQTLFQLPDFVFLQYLHDVGRWPDRAGFVIFRRSECVLLALHARRRQLLADVQHQRSAVHD